MWRINPDRLLSLRLFDTLEDVSYADDDHFRYALTQGPLTLHIEGAKGADTVAVGLVRCDSVLHASLRVFVDQDQSAFESAVYGLRAAMQSLLTLTRRNV